MTASIRIKDEAAPITEDDLCFDQDNDDPAAPYIWLDGHADSDNGTPVEEDSDFVDIQFDHVPTLHEIVEHSFAFSEDDSQVDNLGAERVFCEPGDDMLQVQLSATDAASEMLEKVEESCPDRQADNGGALADHHGDSSQVSLQDVFNLTRYEPAQLQKALLALACTFQIIAAAALWRAVGDKVIVTELVPPLVYASIGVVAYLLGMRYLRIHFAQVRVGDKDWLLCEQVMVAANNGVMLKARFGTAYLIWEQLLGVAQDGDYYYLLIEPSQGFKVPKQGVSDPVLKTKFEDLASLTRAKALQGM
jgi:hypothetical protein